MSADKSTQRPAAPHAGSDDPVTPRRRSGVARVRRRPNIPAFLVTGGLVGLILGVLYSYTTGNGGYSDTAGTAYVAVVFAVFGVLIGALLVIFLDKRADR